MNLVIAFVDSRFQFQVTSLLSSFDVVYCDTYDEFLTQFTQAPCPALGLFVTDIDMTWVSDHHQLLFSKSYLKEIVMVDLGFNFDKCAQLMTMGAFDVISMVEFNRSLAKLCHSGFQLMDAFLKLRLMCEKTFLHDVDPDRWDHFFKDHIWNCRLNYQLVTLDDILLNFPVYVMYTPEHLARMEKRSTEFQFTKKLLGLDELHLLIVEPMQSTVDAIKDILPPYFQLLHAKDGEDALGIIDDFPTIDIGIVSSHMVDIEYSEFSQMLRHFNPDIQLLGMTCHGEDGEVALLTAFEDVLDVDIIGPEWTSKLFYLAQLHYVYRSLPRLGNYILDSDRKSKLKMLLTFCEEKWASKQVVTYRDVYLFFPELRSSGLSETVEIPVMTADLLEDKLVELLQI